MSKAPYRLFDYYRYEDRDLFFGRDEEVARLVGDILSSRLLVLFAPSGSGKSSLLRAGVQPALEKRGFSAVFTRVGEDPIRSITTAIQSLDGPPSPAVSDLVGALKTRSKPVIVFIDQFEELFVQFGIDSEKRKDFPVRLAEAVFDPTLRVYFVLSLRSEYFVCLNEFREAIPSIFQNNANLELRPFDDEAAHAAIVGPSEIDGSNFTWEKGLPEQIIRDSKAREINPSANGVLPLTLQIVCHTLWSRLLPEGRGEITEKSYRDEGGAAAMIKRRIFSSLESVPQGNRRFLCRLLRELITKDGLKRMRSLDQLHGALGERQRRRTDALLARLRDDLLLREESVRGETWVELHHDFLAAQVKPWLENEERRLDQRRRRNYVITSIGAAVIAAVGVWLIREHQTYTAEIAAKIGKANPADELVVTRRAAFGKFELPGWEFRVETGFLRSQLQDGGIPHILFGVLDAPSDWSAVGEHLTKAALGHLVLATSLDSIEQDESRVVKGSNVSPHYEALECVDVDCYEAADDNLILFAIQALKDGDSKIKSTAASALGSLREKLPADRVGMVVDALLAAFKGNDSNVKISAAYALGGLREKLPASRAGEVVDALLAALKGSDRSLWSATAVELGEFGASLPDRAGAVVGALSDTLKDSDFGVAISSASALGELGAKLPDRAKAVINVLQGALKDSDAYVKPLLISALGRVGATLADDQAGVVNVLLAALKGDNADARMTAAFALGSFGPKLPADRTEAVVDALLVAFKESDPLVKGSAAFALGSLEAKQLADRTEAVLDALLDAALKESDSSVKRKAASALGSLGVKLPEDEARKVVDALLAALKDSKSDVKISAASALGSFGLKLPPDRTKAVVDALLGALKDNETAVEISAASALGSLGAKLPADQAGAVVDVLLATLTLGEGDADVMKSSSFNNNDRAEAMKSAASALWQLKAATSAKQVAHALILLSHILASRPSEGGTRADLADESQKCIRELTRGDDTLPTDKLVQDLASSSSSERIVAIHMLARRNLSPEQIKTIRDLRYDPDRRPWVRMAALDTLMEIEREKDLAAREKKEAEEKAKAEKEHPDKGP